MVRDPAKVIARRHLKRRLIFWRIAAVLAFAGLALVLVHHYDESKYGDYIARLKISGFILSDTARNVALRKAIKQEKLRALILEIESPGGTFVGGESLFKSLREVAKHKPVIAVLGNMATSAAYMAALGADRIYARIGTITGSIGVIMQTADIRDLLAKVGIKPETIKSGPLKAQPNPVEPFTAAGREATEKVVGDLFEWFLDIVEERRGIARETAVVIADGRVFSGRQALANGLVDEIGGMQEARIWLAQNYQIDIDIPLEDLEIKDKPIFWRSFLDTIFRKTLFSERLRLDGAVSVWQRYLY